jgi:hypothetical protein
MPIVPDRYRGTPEYDAIRELLIDAARRGTIVFYMPKISSILGFDAPSSEMAMELAYILGEISEDEHLAGRPLLSAVAIGQSNTPGKGFFTLARELGSFRGTDENAYWQDELKAVYRQWGNKGNSL